MNNTDIQAIIDTIAERTEENDHNQALIMASMLLDSLTAGEESKRTKILKHIREIHYLKTYMPEPLQHMREDYRPIIMQGLKDATTPNQYEAIKGAL